MRLATLVIRHDSLAAPELQANGETVQSELLAHYGGGSVFRYSFLIAAAADAGYSLDGTLYSVTTGLDGELQFAYVSCNGQERGDREPNATCSEQPETDGATPLLRLED